MADSSYSQNNMGTAHKPIKLRDLGDDTYAVVQMNIGAWDYANISAAGTNTLKSGPGVLGSVTVNKTVSLGVITVYDNTAGSGTVIATITHPLSLLQSQYILTFNCKFSTGLTVVTSLGDNITVTYM